MNRKISLLQCNDTHLHGMLKGWKFIVCFRVWQLAILQMGYPHCNINKLYHDDTKHNRGKRNPLITHQKAAFCQKPCCSRVQVYLCVQCCYSVWPKIETYVVWYLYCVGIGIYKRHVKRFADWQFPLTISVCKSRKKVKLAYQWWNSSADIPKTSLPFEAYDSNIYLSTNFLSNS